MLTKRKYIAVLIAGAIVFLLIGMGIGSMFSGDANSAPAPTPEPVVETKTVEVEKEVTVEVEVPVTPKSCIDALDAGDAAFMTTSQAMDIVAKTFTAISEMNLDALEKGSEGLSSLTPVMEQQMDEYMALSADCRREGK